MAGRIVPDGLWKEIEPLFPVHEQSPDGGRKPIDNRTVFTLLVFRLKTGLGWRDLPTEMGASQCTVRRRLKEWSELGLFAAIVDRLLTRLKIDGRLELAEVLIDGGLLKAPLGGENAGRTQKPGTAPRRSTEHSDRPASPRFGGPRQPGVNPYQSVGV